MIFEVVCLGIGIIFLLALYVYLYKSGYEFKVSNAEPEIKIPFYKTCHHRRHMHRCGQSSGWYCNMSGIYRKDGTLIQCYDPQYSEWPDGCPKYGSYIN